ncbi:MAG: DUF3108 domain-containing protein [Bacteroidales bacterium]|nr:DUF3108 domain-containing protein [Candidatus Hennigimonas equi]
MRRTGIVITAVLSAILMFPLSSGGQQGCIPVYARNAGDVAYSPGERLSFSIHYTWGILDADMGVAEISLDTVTVNGTPAFHCRVTGSSVRIYDYFFKVREDFNSWFACDGLSPIRFTRDTHEGRYFAWNEYNYRWDAEKPYADAVVRTSKMKEKHLQLPLKTCTADLPALFFYARNIDMSRVTANVKHPMSFVIDDELFDVYFIYKGKCIRNVKGLGSVRCLEFAAKLLEGEVFKGDKDLTIYISDDPNRLPVSFGAPILVGHLEGRLTGYSGLKYEFSSLEQVQANG